MTVRELFRQLRPARIDLSYPEIRKPTAVDVAIMAVGELIDTRVELERMATSEFAKGPVLTALFTSMNPATQDDGRRRREDLRRALGRRSKLERHSDQIELLFLEAVLAARTGKALRRAFAVHGEMFLPFG